MSRAEVLAFLALHEILLLYQIEEQLMHVIIESRIALANCSIINTAEGSRCSANFDVNMGEKFKCDYNRFEGSKAILRKKRPRLASLSMANQFSLVNRSQFLPISYLVSSIASSTDTAGF